MLLLPSRLSYPHYFRHLFCLLFIFASSFFPQAALISLPVVLLIAISSETYIPLIISFYGVSFFTLLYVLINISLNSSAFHILATASSRFLSNDTHVSDMLTLLL